MRDRLATKKWLFSLAVVLAAVAAAAIMIVTKPEPPRAEPAADGVLVSVSIAQPADHQVAVQAKGTVVAAQEVMLQPELAGRVTWQSPNLVPGGVFAKGDALVKIDNRDYQLAVERGRAELNKAQLDFALEQRRSGVAKKEWETFGDSAADPQQKALALREPQLATAKVGVSAARSSLKKAQLDLKRTTLTAPFNAVVVSESIDVGQFITAQNQIAKLVGIDEFRVRVSVPVSLLPTIRVRQGEKPGSKVSVTQSLGSDTISRDGEVVQRFPDLDPSGAMARVLVSIKDPMGNGQGPPLLIGSFVNVAIDAGSRQDVVKVPRSAVRDGSRVHIMNDDDLLEVRNVDVVWGLQDFVLVGSGLKPGERIVTSRIATPVPNMLLRLPEPKTPAESSTPPTAEAPR